jgi:hypothetical protein
MELWRIHWGDWWPDRPSHPPKSPPQPMSSCSVPPTSHRAWDPWPIDSRRFGCGAGSVGIVWPVLIFLNNCPDWRGRFSPFGDQINDMLVGLDEVRMGQGDQVIELPVMHSLMMDHPAVQAAVINAFQGCV